MSLQILFVLVSFALMIVVMMLSHCHSYPISSSHTNVNNNVNTNGNSKVKLPLTPELSWLDWPILASHHPQPMNKDLQHHALMILESLTNSILSNNGNNQNLEQCNQFLKQYLHRVDHYVINKFGEDFLFAWPSHICHDLNHNRWQSTNGHIFASLIAKDLYRLRHSHIFDDRTQVAIDIGAHVGDSTLPIAFLAKQTIAFEPSSSTFPFLRANAALNPELNITVYPLAIAPIDQPVTFRYDYESNGGDNPLECNGGIVVNNDTNSTRGLLRGLDDVNSKLQKNKFFDVTKQAVQLESFLLSHHGMETIRDIAYIKIDAEGYDAAILSSIHHLLSTITHYPVIQVDYLFHRAGGDSVGSGSKTILNAGGRSLFRAIRDLPGEYKPYCIHPCDADKVTCSFSVHEILLHLDEGTNEVGSVSMKSGDALICDDILLYPANYRRMPREL